MPSGCPGRHGRWATRRNASNRASAWAIASNPGMIGVMGDAVVWHATRLWVTVFRPFLWSVKGTGDYQGAYPRVEIWARFTGICKRSGAPDDWCVWGAKSYDYGSLSADPGAAGVPSTPADVLVGWGYRDYASGERVFGRTNPSPMFEQNPSLALTAAPNMNHPPEDGSHAYDYLGPECVFGQKVRWNPEEDAVVGP
jgi:hypothetical protein